MRRSRKKKKIFQKVQPWEVIETKRGFLLTRDFEIINRAETGKETFENLLAAIKDSEAGVVLTKYRISAIVMSERFYFVV